MTCIDYTSLDGAPSLAKQKPYIPCKRSLVQGIGRNDLPYPINVKGKIATVYRVWADMLLRCSSDKFKKANETYRDCTVSDEWCSLAAFESWFLVNYREGYVLDKDILIQGNTLYSKDTCIFAEPTLNTLLGSGTHRKSNLPLGATLTNRGFKASVRSFYYRKHLGYYDTPLEAHKAWQLAKASIIEAFPTTDPRIRAALDLRAQQLRDDHANNRITEKL